MGTAGSSTARECVTSRHRTGFFIAGCGTIHFVIGVRPLSGTAKNGSINAE
jgi:hypothetical protein